MKKIVNRFGLLIFLGLFVFMVVFDVSQFGMMLIILGAMILWGIVTKRRAE